MKDEYPDLVRTLAALNHDEPNYQEGKLDKVLEKYITDSEESSGGEDCVFHRHDRAKLDFIDHHHEHDHGHHHHHHEECSEPVFSKWKNYAEVFNNLVEKNEYKTAWPIISMMITYDSTRVIAVTKEDDMSYYIRQFCLFQNKLVVSEKFGGTDDSYIKMKDVEQNADGTKYAIAFFDNGFFKLRTFDKK